MGYEAVWFPPLGLPGAETFFSFLTGVVIKCTVALKGGIAGEWVDLTAGFAYTGHRRGHVLWVSM